MNKYSLEDNLFNVVERQENELRDFGFAWEHVGQLLEQIRSECLEVEEAHRAGDQKHLQEEIGDLLQAAISLAVFCKMDPQETLLNSINKFQERFDQIMELAQKDGHASLHNQPFSVLMSYWDRAKRVAKKII